MSAELAAENAALRAEIARLEAEVEESAAALRRLGEDFVAVSQHRAHLAALWTASRRLAGAAEIGDALAAIQEICVDLLGVDACALYALVGSELRPLRAHNVPAERLAVGAPEVREALTVLRPVRAPAPGILAAVPLVVGGRARGALVIHRLVEQKRELSPDDDDVLQLLAEQGGVILHLVSKEERE